MSLSISSYCVGHLEFFLCGWPVLSSAPISIGFYDPFLVTLQVSLTYPRLILS